MLDVNSARQNETEEEWVVKHLSAQNNLKLELVKFIYGIWQVDWRLSHELMDADRCYYLPGFRAVGFCCSPESQRR